MITLAIESSTETGGVAVVGKSDGLLYQHSWRRSHSHAETLTPAIERACLETGRTLKDFDFYSVGIGPGSFTGIRVGLNVVKTLAYANKIPVFAKDSLSIMAEALPLTSKKVFCIQNAFSNLLYLSAHESNGKKWKSLKKPQLINQDELFKNLTKGAHLVGEVFAILPAAIQKKCLTKVKYLSNISLFPDAATLGRVAIRDHSPARLLSWEDLKPLYIRLSAAEEKLGKHQLNPVL